MRTIFKIATVITLLTIAACQTATTNPTANGAATIEDTTPSPIFVVDNTLEDEETTGSSPRLRGAFTLQILPEKTKARYIVEEEFFGQGFATAIGVTNVVEGEIAIDIEDTPRITDGEFRVDLRSLASGETRRDNAIRGRWLESDQYPFAVFSPTGVTDFPTDFGFNEGEEVHFKLHGDMTIREVTRNLSFDVTAVGNGDTLEGRATTQLLMTDFGFDPPSIINVLAAENEVIVELDFALQNIAP